MPDTKLALGSFYLIIVECGLALLELGQGRRNKGCSRWDFGRYIESIPNGGTLRPPPTSKFSDLPKALLKCSASHYGPLAV